MNLPPSIILHIIEFIQAEQDKFSFASTNKNMWAASTIPSMKPVILKRRINFLTIRRLTRLMVENFYYEPRLIEHVLRHAINLREITFEYRDKFPIKFIQMFTALERPCSLIVPIQAFHIFEVVADDSENTKLTIEMNVDSSPAEGIKTPEKVKQRADLFKKIEKIKYLEEHKDDAVYKNQLSHLITNKIRHLFNPYDYILYNNNHSKNKVISIEEADQMVRFSEKFVEAVVILDNYWFIATSLCVFIHNQGVDDCADYSRVGGQDEAVAFIRKKTRAGRDYFELTARYSNVELLATSGFFGSTKEPCAIIPFFGSSIQRLPSTIIEGYNTVSTKDIFILNTDIEVSKMPRLLNQYIKAQAGKKWMLISSKFEAEGLTPSHPLSFSSQHHISVAASLLLRIFATKNFNSEEIDKAISDIQTIPTSLSTSDKKILKYLSDLKGKEDVLMGAYDLIELKKDMLNIYERILAGAIRTKNIGLVRKAEAKYK